MDKDIAKIHNHFEKMSDIFDSIYKGKQSSLLYKTIDLLFRENILERRLNLILNLCADVRGKNILDIGCGPGRYAVILARSKPNLVLGLDISTSMIDLAKKLARASNTTDICKFENCDFLQKKFNDKFDIVIVAGVFDYVANPKAYLLKLKGILRGKAIFSFPVKWSVLTLARMLWLKKKDCPNFYYSKRKIKDLFAQSGLKIGSIHKIGSFLVPGNYIVVCRP